MSCCLALAGFIVLQGLRLWILATLGARWTTRIIVLRDAPLVASGPYRYLSHPNYAVVAGEIALLPLALHLPWLALIFTVLNAAVLAIRIRAEAHALSAIGGRLARPVHEQPAGVRVTPRSYALRSRTWAGFLLMCLGMFMAILDIQVVATSLPAIQQALAISPDAMSWVQTAYLIAEVIAIPLTGLFTRVLTLRWLVAAAVALFTLASIGCAYSGGFAVLLVFRVVQGFAGGVLIPAVFTAVFLLFPPSLHAVATTIGGVVAVLAPTVGPVVGGWITETWSWPWLFLINVIPGLIVTVGDPVPVAAPEHESRRACEAGQRLSRAAGAALACLEIGLEGSAPSRLVVAYLHGACWRAARSAWAYLSIAAWVPGIRWCGLPRCSGVRLRSAAP